MIKLPAYGVYADDAKDPYDLYTKVGKPHTVLDVCEKNYSGECITYKVDPRRIVDGRLISEEEFEKMQKYDCVSEKPMPLSANEYQALAKRTIDGNLDKTCILYHALHGMASEVGEIHGVIQKHYQGHEIDSQELMLEVGDLLWFIAEYCTAAGWELEDVMLANIEKLKKRYPNGFEAERSINRGQ